MRNASLLGGNNTACVYILSRSAVPFIAKQFFALRISPALFWAQPVSDLHIIRRVQLPKQPTFQPN